MKNKYYNDAIIGNKNIVASFSKKGEILRLFYPIRDYRQYIDTLYAGVKINDSSLIYLHDDINNQYNQYYTESTNILNTEIKNTYFNLSIVQTDFVSISNDVLIKKYVLKNENSIDLNVSFLMYSRLLTDQNNMVSTKIQNNICMQYTHDYTFCIFSKENIHSYRLHNSDEEIKSGVLNDKDYIGIGEDCGINYELGTLKPGETKDIEIFIYINSNDNISRTDNILENVERIRKLDTEKEFKLTEKYWQKYVKEHDGLKLMCNQEQWENKISNFEKVKSIYIRSILLFPLLSNEETGGISAAIEVDENQTKCGRYSYCWPRDAVFLTRALDILNMNEQADKFYRTFSQITQSKNGMWEQRFYTDGRLAPSWGYQIDETASIVYGVYEHYKYTRDIQFLKDTYQMCKNAIEALKDFCHVESGKINLFKKYESFDLWEMHEGIHLYSLAAIYAAFKAMIHIEEILSEKDSTNNSSKVNISDLEKNAEKVKEYCMKNFTSEENRTLIRNNKDNKCDISLLGTIIPFEMFSINSKEVKNTIEKINWTLRTYTGGYLRFENDNYLDGNYPWPIATLWMALYNLKIGNTTDALKQIDFVTNTSTEHGFLAEQVDNENKKAKWVIGLGWSHAMYIIALGQLGQLGTFPFG